MITIEYCATEPAEDLKKKLPSLLRLVPSCLTVKTVTFKIPYARNTPSPTVEPLRFYTLNNVSNVKIIKKKLYFRHGHTV